MSVCPNPCARVRAFACQAAGFDHQYDYFILNIKYNNISFCRTNCFIRQLFGNGLYEV